jgi:cytosine/adenosine deaminase-related metal-dependent hydrolase
MKSRTVGRWILTSDGVKKGFLRIEGDSLIEVCWGDAPTDSTKGLVLPAFVNAHTHIGDTVACPAPKGTVKEIVGPPNGYKHRMLRSKSADEKTAAMRSAVEMMKASGTALFADFREEGIEGLKYFRDAVGEGSPHAIVFGRPTGTEPTRKEVNDLLRACDGLGFSAISDWPAAVLKTMSRQAKAAGKLFAIHASEAAREDIDSIFDLKPDFLVHMCKATKDDLVACEDADVPIVVCPTSNRFFGLDPNIPRLLKAGITVGLGTDNGMIARPDMLAELKTAYALSNERARARPLEIVGLATFGGRKVLNADAKITTEINENSDLVVIRTSGKDPLKDLVTKSDSGDILAVIQGRKVGRTSAWRT